MNRLTLILSLILIASCSNSQSWEMEICDCIKNNYNLNEWNYFKEINAFKKEMIDRDKFSLSLESQIELLNSLSSIEYVDFYKFQFSERLLTFGEESIEYCVRRELFNKDCTERHWSEYLVRKLKSHKIQLVRDGNLKLYNERMAKSIVTAISSSEGDEKLKQLFLLQELYRRIPDQALYNLDQTKLKMIEASEKRKNTVVPVDAIKIYTTEESKLEIDGIENSIDDLCKIILEPIKDGKLIHLTTSRKTGYKFYLSIYEKLIECLGERKNSLSNELFNKNYENLNQNEKNSIDKEVKNHIIEGE